MNKFLAVFALFCVFSISSIYVYASIRTSLNSNQPLEIANQNTALQPLADRPSAKLAKDTVTTVSQHDKPTKTITIDSSHLKNKQLFTYVLQTNFGSEKFRGSYAFSKVVDSIHDILDTNHALRLYVTGHTDSIGKAIDNEWIGMQRAKNVANYLKRKGINQQQMIVSSEGENKPLEGYTSIKENRRIELIIK